MRHGLTLVATLWLIASPTVARGQSWVAIDFQDSDPPTMVWANGSRDLAITGNPGACAAGGPFWNYSRAASGGHDGRGYYEWHYCEDDVTGSSMTTTSSGWGESGFHFRPAAGWPTEFCGRFRVEIVTPILPSAGSDTNHQFKWFQWHSGVFDGDQRVIGFFQSGASCSGSDETSVCWSLQRNIFHPGEVAQVSIPIGGWNHLQFCWRHGAEGQSYLRVWLNNNDLAAPSAQDLTLPTVPAFPGGTSDWVIDPAGYDMQFFFGNTANTGTGVVDEFVVRVMDFELGDAFDPTWAPTDAAADAGASGGGRPDAAGDPAGGGGEPAPGAGGCGCRATSRGRGGLASLLVLGLIIAWLGRSPRGAARGQFRRSCRRARLLSTRGEMHSRDCVAPTSGHGPGDRRG